MGCPSCKKVQCCCPEKRVSVKGAKGDPGPRGPSGPAGAPGQLASLTIANTAFVAKNGSDSTGIVERLDKPFLTIAGARAAVDTYYVGGIAPSASNRIMIRVYSGTYNESIILKNFVDYDLGDAVINQDVPDAATGSLITDNGVQVNSIIIGQANLVGTAGEASQICGIKIQNSMSRVVVNINDISLSSAGIQSQCIGILSVYGNLTVNLNNINIELTESASLGCGIFVAPQQQSRPKLFVKATGNIHVVGIAQQQLQLFGIRNDGGYLYFDGVDIIVSGSASQSGVYGIYNGFGYMKFNNLYLDAEDSFSSGVFFSAGDLYIKYNQSFCRQVGSFGGDMSGIEISGGDASGELYVECFETNVEANTTTDLAVKMVDGIIGSKATLKGRYVVEAGAIANANCIKKNSSDYLILDCATLIAPGTGKCITSDNVTDVYIYGSCQANKLIDVAFAITLLVGTVANGRFIENSSDVI